MENNFWNEIQTPIPTNQSKEVSDMILYLTQSHVFIQPTEKNKNKVLLVQFNENLQKIVFKSQKKVKKIVMLSDICHSEAGFSKETILKIVKEDQYGMKIVTKKRIIELSTAHKSQRDSFVKNINLLLQITAEWKSTIGLRLYFEKCLEKSRSFKREKISLYPDLERQVIKDTVDEMIQKIDLRFLELKKRALHDDLKYIEYENRYLSDQLIIFESQVKTKDRTLEAAQMTYTYLQHKYYIKSIINKSEKSREYMKSWRKILEFLDSLDLLALRKVNKFFFKLTKSYLSCRTAWVRLSFSGLNPRKVLWTYYLQKFHPYNKDKSILYSDEVHDEIRKDVYRGLPDRSEEVEDALNTICSLDYDVGYCQGMQLVTHFLFTVLNDGDQVVETLKSLMDPPYFMAEIWKNGFCRLKLAIFQLENLVNLKMPFLLKHLRKIEINLDIIVTPWIVTVFTHMMYQQKLPTETMKHIWDMFIISGWPILISTSLALLYLSIDEVMDKSLEETLNFFSSGTPSLSIKTIKKFFIDQSLLDQLEESFNSQNK
jgi:Rab-GTPase-TBC domain